MSLRRMTFKIFAAAAVIVLPFMAPAAAADFPTRPITLVVPYGPGDGSDLLGRMVAKYLSAEIGQPVIVQNRPGATGGIGTEDVIHSTPDGYTLVLGTNSTLITTPIMYPSMNYSPVVDLIPVGMVGRGAMVLATRTTQPSAATLKDLIAELHARPSNYAAAGIGTNGDVISRIMLKQIGASASLVTYKQGGEALMATIRGDTAFMVNTPTAILPFFKSGLLRPLAVTGTKRLVNFPDTPTFKELGVPGLGTIYAWYGIFAPADTPPDVIQILSRKLAATVQEPVVQAQLNRIEVEPFPMQTGPFTAFVKSDIKTFGGFVRGTGITASK